MDIFNAATAALSETTDKDSESQRNSAYDVETKPNSNIKAMSTEAKKDKRPEETEKSGLMKLFACCLPASSPSETNGSIKL